MSIYRGSTEILDGNLYVGNQAVAEVYVGANKIWPPVVLLEGPRFLENAVDRRVLENATDVRVTEGVSSYSAPVQAVLDRMSALTAGEIAAIEAFVDGCEADGNWSLIDEFWCFALNATDWLTGWKAFTATAGGTVARGANGMVIPVGAGNHVETGIDLSTLVQYSLNDAEIGIYAHTVADWGTVNNDIFGVEEDSNARTRLRHRGSDTNDFRNSINSTATADNNEILPLSKTLYSLRDTATNGLFLVDAVAQPAQQSAGVVVPTGYDVWIGAANNKGAESQSPQNGTFTSFYVGAPLNTVQFLSRLNTLHTALGVS